MVQVVLNKNDRGVITPDRFNDLANMVQSKVFAELPDDIRRCMNRKNAGYNTLSLDVLRDAFDGLSVGVDLVRSSSAPFYFRLPDNMVSIDTVFCDAARAERVDFGKVKLYENNALVKPTPQYPVYALVGRDLLVSPAEVQSISVVYRRSVSVPKWTYLNVAGKPVFNPADKAYRDFELPFHFFNRIVMDMLTYLGLHLKEQEVIQVAQQEQSWEMRRGNEN